MLYFRSNQLAFNCFDDSFQFSNYRNEETWPSRPIWGLSSSPWQSIIPELTAHLHLGCFSTGNPGNLSEAWVSWGHCFRKYSAWQTIFQLNMGLIYNLSSVVLFRYLLFPRLRSKWVFSSWPSFLHALSLWQHFPCKCCLPESELLSEH